MNIHSSWAGVLRKTCKNSLRNMSPTGIFQRHNLFLKKKKKYKKIVILTHKAKSKQAGEKGCPGFHLGDPAYLGEPVRRRKTHTTCRTALCTS
jgi:hypothetical protein